MKILTVVVPCYNSAAYLRRCVDSLLTGDDDVEILIVDDGSTDETGDIADSYAARLPGVVAAIHQPNAGHGGAVNTGVRLATGRWIKIVDSDDRLDGAAYAEVLRTLRGFAAGDEAVDMVVSNFVYDKTDRRRKTAVRYRGVLPSGRVLAWDEVGDFGTSQYILMHSLIYRTELLRECGLRLPEHTFYVDILYASVPLVHVKRLYYLDVDLYRYHIGRADQSVNDDVMLRRVGQYLRVNRRMMTHLSEVRSDPTVPQALCRYLVHYAEIVCAVSSVLLIRVGTPESLAMKDELWSELRQQDPWLYRRLRRSVVGQLANLPGRPGRGISRLAYRAAQWAVGFN